MEQVKTCSRCKRLLTRAHFNKDASQPGGLKRACKECIRVSSASYYAANAEKLVAKSRTYNQENKEKIKKRRADYYKTHAEKEKLRTAIYRKNNYEKCLTAWASYYKENKESIDTQKASYRKAHPEVARALDARSRENLSQKYIRSLLRRGTSLHSAEIPKPLIELKRAQLLLARELRKAKK